MPRLSLFCTLPLLALGQDYFMDIEEEPQAAPQAAPQASTQDVLTAALVSQAEAAAQDPRVSSMAMGMASQMAEVVMDKVTDKIENGKLPDPCVGPECCQASTCMDIPGFHCAASRGATKCVGYSSFPPQKGMCACLEGPCSSEGKCSSAPASVPVHQSQDLIQPLPQHQAQVGSQAASGDQGWTSVTQLDNQDNSGFSKWHAGTKLYEAGEMKAEPRQNHRVLVFLLPVVSALGLTTLFAFRKGRSSRLTGDEENGQVVEVTHNFVH